MLGTANGPRRRRARRGGIAVFGVVLALLGLAAPSVARAAVDAGTERQAAGPSSDPIIVPEVAELAEPFDRPTSDVATGPLADKWQAVQQTIAAEMGVVALCRFDLTLCPSTAAIEFLSIVERARQHDGLAQAGEVNRAINMEIRPAEDIALYNAEDVWSSPLATLTIRAGDCEDYAIAKYVALRAAGVAADGLRLVILRDARSHADHAVVAMRIAGHWRILDNRRLLMLDDQEFVRAQTRVRLEPIFSLSENGIRRYDDGALVASASAPAPIF